MCPRTTETTCSLNMLTEASTCSLQNSDKQTGPSATQFMDICQTMSHEVSNLENNKFETSKLSENPSTPTAAMTQLLEESTSISQYMHNTQAYFPGPYSTSQLNQLKQLTEATKFSELLTMFKERNLTKNFIALLDFM